MAKNCAILHATFVKKNKNLLELNQRYINFNLRRSLLLTEIPIKNKEI